MRIRAIATIIEGIFLNKEIHETDIKHLLYDSRKLSPPNISLFFALLGKQDGHKYIAELYEKGVTNFVVSEKLSTEAFPKANFLWVKNTLRAMQLIAQWHREQFPSLKTIGITGSNGKTIVKEWLFQLLQADYEVVRSPKSFNSQIGVPLSVWQIEEQHQIGIFEAGISHPHEMEYLAAIIQPTVGIFTNIGTAHTEGFERIEQKIHEKLLLFEKAQTIIYSRDYPILHQLIQAKYPHKTLIAWSKNDILAEQKTAWELLRQHVPFTDEASLENAMHCLKYLQYEGYSLAHSLLRLHRLEKVALRLEMKTAINDSLLINDSYSADFSSLLIALDFLNQQKINHRLTVILSDILQTGKTPERLYANIAEVLKEKKINRLIGIGQAIQKIRPFLTNRIQSDFYDTTEEFLTAFRPDWFHEENILLKGARHFEFEKIASRLELKAHKTVLEINLTALANNFNTYKKIIRPTTKIMVMVKAAGYGSGGYEIAHLIEYLQADYLAVAYIDEGVELRKAGIKLPIMVLNPEDSGLEAMFAYQLEPEIYSTDLLRRLLLRLQAYKIQKSFPIHLKIDTGMHRLGFEEKDIAELSSILIEHKHLVQVQSIFSHLASSDSASDDAFTTQQYDKLVYFYHQIRNILPNTPLLHLLNSRGIVRFPAFQLDMVRLGIGLYGIDDDLPLETVSTLKASISQIKMIPAGETIGYNRRGKALNDMRIATISIGYADGFSRRLSGGKGTVFIKGSLCPVVGTVCMDMCMIDISAIPNAQVGDEVIIFGKEKSVLEFAKELNTIPYEVFTSISNRVKRVYFQE
jgi:alanine racemase